MDKEIIFRHEFWFLECICCDRIFACVKVKDHNKIFCSYCDLIDTELCSYYLSDNEKDIIASAICDDCVKGKA